ncbi:MAG: hypothetical protein Q8R96_00920 [Bacteroidota bacterium]|nr:hypothetical protein [Bacteroidota bacterium]
MQSSPRQFNKQRIHKNPTGGIIKTTVDQIMRYVIDCYLYMLEEKPQFSKSDFKETTTYKFEDLLSDRFVDDYLRKRRKEYFSHTLLNQIIFTKQSSENYINCFTHIHQPDLIDIYVTNLQIDKELSSNPQPYFAIECKRIRKSSSIDEYVGDIKKFTERIHSQPRLPYEGQIAFIEKSQYPHNVTKEKINNKLGMHESIKTIQPLKHKQFHEMFDGSYCSKHLKNFGIKNEFAIYHLMLNYTQIVTD